MVAKGLREPGSEVAAVAYVYAVLNGNRTVPIGAEAAWAEVLGWETDSAEYPAFLEMVEAARAWGHSPKHGRAHVAKLEMENVALTARVCTLDKALTLSESKRRDLAATAQKLADRIAFLEASELKRGRAGDEGI